jgi:hypothetical protein
MKRHFGTLLGACGLLFVWILLSTVLAQAQDPDTAIEHSHRHDGFFVPRPVWVDYYQPFNPGEPRDGQFRFDTSLGLKLYDFWDEVDIYGVSRFSGKGHQHEVSAPVSFDAEPQFFARRTLGPDLSVDYGWWHESNGQDGEESRSWDRQFVRANVTGKLGPFFYEAHGYAFEAFNVAAENLDLIDRGTKEAPLDGVSTWKGRYGFGAEGRAEWPGHVVLNATWFKSQFQALLGVKMSERSGADVYTALLYWNGKGVVIAEHDEWSEAFGVGLMYVPTLDD